MSRDTSASELLAWTLLGTAIGAVAGFAVGEWLGPLDRARVNRALSGSPRRGETGARLKAAATARAARLTLEGDPELADLRLEPIAVGPGVVELHGWVGSRRLRARAARLVAATEGIDSLINRILVRGEDDAAESREVADQTA